MRKNSEKGFTVVELLVSMAIFAVVISVASTVFIRSLRAQRAVVKLIEVNENTSITIEKVAREIRTGTGFAVSSAGSQLSFINARGDSISYLLSQNRFQQQIGSILIPLTGSGVYVEDLEFVLQDRDPITRNPSVERVTITMTVGLPPETQDISEVKSNIQTTVSVRALNASSSAASNPPPAGP